MQGNYHIEPIGEFYNDEMLSIIKASPIVAKGLELYFDKSPDIFEIGRMKYEECKHVGFFLNDELKGFASIGYSNALIGGTKEKVFTLFHFYLLPEARGRHFPEKAVKFFFEDQQDRSNFGCFVTMKGNRQAESFIGRQGYRWIPPSRVIDDLVVKSIFFSFPKKNHTSYTVRNARVEDIPEIVWLLKLEHEQRDFGEIIQEDVFLRKMEKRGLKVEEYYLAENKKGEIKGVCLAWDCYSFRRTRVLKFSSAYSPVLYSYKALAKILPMAPFPKLEECFRELTITDYATEGRDTTIMHALLSEIYRRNLNRKYHFMNFASCRSDEFLTAAKGFWQQDIVSNIVFVSRNADRFNHSPRLPYIDIAFL